MKLQLAVTGSRLALAVSVLAFAYTSASAQDTASAPAQQSTQKNSSRQTAPNSTGQTQDVIVVSGVRQSIASAMNEKRDSNEIKDSITAEDIGQLANDNIAEALQRIAGVQVDRSSDGEGKQVQVRGLSDNNVTINGATMTGTGDVDLSNGNDRGVNFQDLPPELFSGVEILKASTADQIEGSLGGTINLQTRAPLKGRRNFIVNISGSDTYRQVGELARPSVNLFLQKKWRNTGLGDFGVILNFGYKRIATLSEVYGGGEYGGAPGVWSRLSGADGTPVSAGPNQSKPKYNFFALDTIGGIPNPYQYALPDVNGDGVANASDTYYVLNRIGLSQRARDDTRRSFNGTLEWKPASNLDIRFDTVLTGLDQSLTGANVNLVSNVPRSGFLIGGPGNTFQQLENTPNFGPVYVMTAGRLASWTTRLGAAPAINRTYRKSQQYSLEATWDLSPNFSVFVQGTHSRGKASTGNFGQLNMGIEDQGGNSKFNTQDFYNFVDFNLGNNLIPNVTLYEDPFPSPNYGVNSVVPESGLTVLNPGDLSYNRLRYFQYQRNAADTNNKDDSARFDIDWENDGGLLRAFKAGLRWAERGFARRAYVNQNQGGGVVAGGSIDPVKSVNVQWVPVDPTNTTNQTNQDALNASAFLQSCLSTTTMQGSLDGFGGNLPQTFGSDAGCDITSVQNYYNLIDIRAFDPTKGAGVYENVPERYSISQDTVAAYVEGDFRFSVGQVAAYGNVGVRYVVTRTSSAGYISNNGTNTYTLTTFNNNYDDWLPSANVNFALTGNLILRLAISRTLGRPKLTQLSPGVNVFGSPNVPGYNGFGTRGNPNLKPVHSTNFDSSLEWYYARDSYMSVAAFAKNIDSTIFLSPTTTDYAFNNKLFSVQTYENFGGTKIKGLEFSLVHAFHYLPGLLSNLGMTGNLTVISEDSSLRDQEGDPISRKGLSHLTYNIGGYYDDGRFSLRLAYNWRSKFTRVEAVSLGYNQPAALPEIEAARGELDFAARFKVNRNVRFSLNVNNLTNTGTYRYLKYPILVNYLARAGRSFNLGAAISF